MQTTNTATHIKADLTLFAVAIIWGTGFIAQGIAGQHHLAYLYNGASFMLAVVILIPFLPRGSKIPRGQWKWMLIAGAVLFAATALQQVGLLYTKVANAGFLTSLYAVCTPFLLLIGFREKPHWMDLVAALVASVGAYFLSTAGQGFHFQNGDSLELLGVLFWSAHFVLLGKYAYRYDAISFAAGHFLVAGVLNFMVGLVVENISQLASIQVIGATVYRAVFSVGTGYTLQVWGQRHTPPTDAALILGLEAVFAAVAAWLILKQELLPVQVAGCVIIFAAVTFSQLKVLKK